MHSDYPELVRTALASNAYWHIPELHKRQLIVATEDSREVEHKLDPAYLGNRLIDVVHRRKAKKLSPGSTYSVPSFEEDLEAFYDRADPVHTSVSTRIDYGAARSATLKRSMFFMIKDEQSGLFLAMHPLMTIVPNHGRSPN